MMGFVHDENCGQTLLMACDRVVAQLEKEIALVLARSRQSKIAGNILKKFCRTQKRIEDIGERDVRAIQDVEEAPDQDGLTSTYFSGENYKAFAPLDSVVQRRQCFVMFRGRKQERRIRRDVEWVPLQIVEAFVHGEKPSPANS